MRAREHDAHIDILLVRMCAPRAPSLGLGARVAKITVRHFYTFRRAGSVSVTLTVVRNRTDLSPDHQTDIYIITSRLAFHPKTRDTYSHMATPVV